MKPLNELGAAQAAALLASGSTTAEALVRACLERIAAREPVIRAWQALGPDAAIARARELDRGPSRGLLHGLPLGVKDLFDTADFPTTYGSAIYAGHRPRGDAAAVAAARAAGAIVMGKTVTTEFAVFQPGPTANPRNPAHTPGGSSSGSAAAVADDMVPLALGTQTAGSIIRPAAYCGVVGYKPTHGLLSRAGVKALSDSLDTVGVLARSVPDCALFAAAVSGRHALVVRDALDTPPRIGIARTHSWNEARPETAAALEAAARTLARAGASVREIALPDACAGLVAAQIDVMGYEAARSLAWEWFERRDGLSPKLAAVIQSGLECTPQRYDAARSLAAQCRRLLPDVFDGVDVLIAPSTTGEAPAGLDATGDPLFCRTWTLLHTPSVHVPFSTGPGGLPVGVQVVGCPGRDADTLAHAHWIHGRLA